MEVPRYVDVRSVSPSAARPTDVRDFGMGRPPGTAGGYLMRDRRTAVGGWRQPIIRVRHRGDRSLDFGLRTQDFLSSLRASIGLRSGAIRLMAALRNFSASSTLPSCLWIIPA